MVNTWRDVCRVLARARAIETEAARIWSSAYFLAGSEFANDLMASSREGYFLAAWLRNIATETIQHESSK